MDVPLSHDIVFDDAEKQCLAVLAHVFVRHGRPERAVPVLRALDRLFPRDPDVIKSLSYASLAAGDAEGGLAAADAYLAARPEGAGAAMIELLRCRALARLGRRMEAEQALQRFLAGMDTRGRGNG